MPKVLSTTTQDNYANSTTIQNVYDSKGGWISNSGTVFCQVQRSDKSTQGTDTWSEEFPLPSGSHFLSEGTIGIRVRSFTMGLSVSFTAVIWWPYEPNMLLGSSGFAQSVSTVITQQVLTATVATNYILPNGCVAILVECIGGGGAGGGTSATGAATASAGGGGAGACFARKLIIAPSPTYSYACGPGGTGVVGAAGNPGTITVFGTACQAGGGLGGNLGGATGTFPGVGALGGAGTGNGGLVGDVLAFGAPGEQSLVLGIAANSATSGQGGIAAGPYGGSGGFVVLSNGLVNGTVGNNYGGGGSGAAANANQLAGKGGNGAPGIIVVTEFY